jgi:SAM-dependent methyltransferase
MKRNQEYDPFAWLYATYWGQEFHEQSVHVLDRLLLHRLPPRAAVLDLCCGDGRLTRQLARRRFKVTGLDGSAHMLAFAKQRAPKVKFLLADARRFDLPDQFDAVISTFDSLNHIRVTKQLAAVFRNVFKALRSPGFFAFDLNREEAYRDLWVRTSHTIEKETVSIARGSYNQNTGLAHCELTQFRLSGIAWERSDFRLTQKYHPEAEVVAQLGDAGFNVQVFDAAKDLGMQGEIGIGRTFYLGCKA